MNGNAEKKRESEDLGKLCSQRSHENASITGFAEKELF